MHKCQRDDYKRLRNSKVKLRNSKVKLRNSKVAISCDYDKMSVDAQLRVLKNSHYYEIYK